MNAKDFVFETLRRQGKASALAVQSKAPEMDGTALISEEDYIPDFSPQKDYSGWKAGCPVQDEGQVWVLLQPHNAAHYDGRPSTLRALWGLAHTTDPAKAKPYVAPFGTSGLYMKGECMKWEDGFVYRSILDNNAYTPESYPDGWELA
jgi:hypothetical protein